MAQFHRSRFPLFYSVALLAASAAVAGDVNIPFSKSNFPAPPAVNEITNPLLPLPVGRTWRYRTQTKDGCEVNTVEVLSSTKNIAIGVTARQVHDVVYDDLNCNESKLNKIEDTLDWYAQDNQGIVWYLGEDTKDCDGNKCTQNPGSWEAGADIDNIGSNGVPGIIMLASPRKGDSYQQEFYAGHAEDIAAVAGVDVDVTLTRPDAYPPGVFHHCLKTKERSTLESGSTANKYYCPGIGVVAEDELSRNGGRVELVDTNASLNAFQFRQVK